MRVELRDGQWAELREHITHGDAKTIRRARDDEGELESAIVRVFVKAWNVVDLDGLALALDAPDAIDRAPSDVVDTLMLAAAELWTAATVPNSPTPPS